MGLLHAGSYAWPDPHKAAIRVCNETGQSCLGGCCWLPPSRGAWTRDYRQATSRDTVYDSGQSTRRRLVLIRPESVSCLFPLVVGLPVNHGPQRRTLGKPLYACENPATMALGIQGTVIRLAECWGRLPLRGGLKQGG